MTEGNSHREQGGRHARAGLPEVWQEAAALPTLSRPAFAMQLVLHALRSFVMSPVTFGACIFTVAVALFVLSAFLLLIHNVGGVLELSRGEASCRLYLRDGVPPEAAAALRAELRAQPGVRDVRLFTKEDALREFGQALSAQAGLLDGLEAENPLPASLRVTAAPGADEVISGVVQRYGQHPAIEYVQYDKELLRKVAEVVRLFRRGAQLSAFFMLLVTGVIIANTVRLTLAMRRDEISIMRLVGASSAFVKAPCLIEGGLHGLVGASVSLLLLYGAWRIVRNAVQAVPIWQMLFPSLSFLPFGTLVLIVIVSVGVGALASLIAVRRIAVR